VEPSGPAFDAEFFFTHAEQIPLCDVKNPLKKCFLQSNRLQCLQANPSSSPKFAPQMAQVIGAIDSFISPFPFY
jgi:hypothetical protein